MEEMTIEKTEENGEKKYFCTFRKVRGPILYSTEDLSTFIGLELESLSHLFVLGEETENFLARPGQVILERIARRFQEVCDAIDKDVGEIDVDLRDCAPGREKDILGVAFTPLKK